jgi:hypothetical protein
MLLGGVAMEERPGIDVRLTPDEAIVLSDWIHRLQNEGVPLGDEAVWLPLYRIGGVLETTLPDIFARDYAERVQAARERLLAKLGHEAESTNDSIPGS